MNTRDYWVNTLCKITTPVFSALAEGKLKEKMPVESGTDRLYCNKEPVEAGAEDVNRHYAYLQAFGRSLAGAAPWLNLPGLAGEEALRQEECRKLVLAAIDNGTRPDSPDLLNFTYGVLPLCDVASFAHGLLRSWDAIWPRLDPEVRANVVHCLKVTRSMEAYYCNWLLFSAMVEACLCRAGEEWDWMRVDYALRQFEQWYLGDGLYGDGPFFHWDYYNSYVINPMLLGIVDTIAEFGGHFGHFREALHQRAQRYAFILERLIAPDGTYPPIGRSLAYRSGAFHCLADMAYRHELPENLTPAQVRCALTAMMHRSLDAEGTFDANGWLTVGFCGHQPEIGEDYMCTGAVYLCSYAFLPLGLAPDDAFWLTPDAAWTAKRVWAGEALRCDHALTEVKHPWMGWT